MNTPHRAFQPNVSVSYGRPLTEGPLLILRDFFAIIRGLGNRAQLAEHREVEISSIIGAPPIRVLSTTLLDFPQFCFGYDEIGRPILVGVRHAMKGHINLCGQTRSGKTTLGASLLTQAIWHGFTAIAIGNKRFDPMLYAMRAAAESQGRPFRLITLDSKMPTSGVNYVRQLRRDAHQPLHLSAGNLLDALNLSAPTEDRPGQFFAGAQLAHLMSTNWGEALCDLNEALKRKSLNRDDQYAIAALTNALSQLARVPQLNLPSSDPSDVDFEWILRERGAVYIEAASLRYGDIANGVCGLALQTLMAAKEAFDPLNKKVVFVFVDEAASFPRRLLRRYVDQCAALNIRLIFAYHAASQFGDDYETLANTQINLVFSAKPGTKTEHYLQAMFGTKKEYRMSVGMGKNRQRTQGWGANESSPIGGTPLTPSWSSESTNESIANGEHKAFTITEHDVPAWTSDDTKWLNDNPLAAAGSFTPRDELTTSLNPGGNRIILGGPPFPFEEIDRVAELAYEPSVVTFLPGRSSHEKQISAPAPRQQKTPSTERTRIIAELKSLGTNTPRFKSKS